MRNKKALDNFLLFFLVLALCVPGFSKDKKVESMWAAAPVIIDGSNDDWAGDALTLEKKVKVDYAFRNDSGNLYVFFSFREPKKYMSTINQTGMTIWLNAEGKKKKTYGINFKQRRVSAEKIIAELEKQRGPMPEAEKKKYKSNPYYSLYLGEVIDKKGNVLIASSLAGEMGLTTFRTKRQGKMQGYEFQIPLRILEKLSAEHAMAPGKMVKIGFEWGGLTKEIKEAGAKRLGDRSAQARVSSATDQATQERRVRSGSSSLSSIRRNAKKYSIWVDLSLAQKQ
jgi:hypothetical protein